MVDVELILGFDQYLELRKVHEFILAACDNREVIYYIEQTKEPPQQSQWKQIFDQASYLTDKSR